MNKKYILYIYNYIMGVNHEEIQQDAVPMEVDQDPVPMEVDQDHPLANKRVRYNDDEDVGPVSKRRKRAGSKRKKSKRRKSKRRKSKRRKSKKKRRNKTKRR